MGIKITTGPSVEGDNFFGREKELKLAWESLIDGNSLILAAPRRIGKTSFSKRMLEKAQHNGWAAIYIDLEGIQTEEKFVECFTDELIKKNLFDKMFDKGKAFLDSVASSIKPTVSAGGVTVSVAWESKKNDVYEKLKNIIKPEKETLIVIDELAIFLNYLTDEESRDTKAMEFFLNWMRSLRQIKGNKIRWIFCSSIGIDNFLSMYGLSYTMNDVTSFPIGELMKKEAKGLVLALCQSKGLEITEEQTEHVLKKLGWALPYFIQLLCAEMYNLTEMNDERVSVELIDRAYNRLLNQRYFNAWNERLKDYAGLESPIRFVLKRLCQIPEGEKRTALQTALQANSKEETEQTNEMLSKILRILINDGYLMEQEGLYGFRSPLLRDFWYKQSVL